MSQTPWYRYAKQRHQSLPPRVLFKCGLARYESPELSKHSSWSEQEGFMGSTLVKIQILLFFSLSRPLNEHLS